MFSRSYRMARIGGVDVRVEPSWVFLVLLVLWSFHVQFTVPGRRSVTTLGMAVAAAVLFFLSLLAHELAHALEGAHRDIEVHGITLMVFGGVTEMGISPRRPRDEFVISAVGPYVSLVAGALFGLIATFATVFGAPAPVAEVAGTLGWLNVFLAVFNFVPGAPLDGGRVLRSAIWAVTRDRHRAVRWASYAGQAVAAALFLLAARLVLLRPAAFVTALWAAFIGWFMWRAARQERRRSEVEVLLEGRTIAALTVVEPPRLPAGSRLEQVADLLAGAPGVEIFPVVDEAGAGEVVGALHVGDVMDIAPQDRATRAVRDLMRPIADLRQVPEDEDLLEVAAIVSHGDPIVVVDAGGRARALVTPGQLQAALDRWHALARRREHHLPVRREHSP